MEAINLHLIIIGLISVAFPVYAIATGKSTRNLLLDSPDKKIFVYKHTIGLQLVLAFLVFLSMTINNNHLSEIGLDFLYSPLLIIILIVISLLVLLLLNRIKITQAKAEKYLLDSEDVLYILPATAEEYKWTIVLSFIVGALEEIIFRGYLYWQLHQYMPLLPALILTNIVFGLCHYGTKLKNAFSAFLLGSFWSITYLLTDSLWFAILIHICIDLYSSTMAVKSFAFKNEDSVV